MNIEQIREFCLKKKGVTEEFPFDEETLVFKVAGKIFYWLLLKVSLCKLILNAILKKLLSSGKNMNLFSQDII